MDREINMEEVSDGRWYGLNDLVKVGCDDCRGCSACCRGMGSSITLDPYDVDRLTEGLHKSFGELLEESLELNVVDGMILPNLKMAGDGEACAYLNEEGRCSVHEFRPGICRLFPLGRFYEDGSFRYFLQVHECARKNRTKVKLRKWLGLPEPGRYEAFVSAWHYFLRGLQQEAQRAACGEAGEEGQERAKRLNLYLLQQFFVRPFLRERDFYDQFYERLNDAKAYVAALPAGGAQSNFAKDAGGKK